MPGLPVQCPALWSVKDLQDDPIIWPYQLSEADVSELYAVVDGMQTLDVDLNVMRS